MTQPLSMPQKTNQGFILPIIAGIAAVVFLVVTGVAIYEGKQATQQKLGATILQTQLSDTIGTFRTNVNTSLANLNADIATITSTQSSYGTIVTQNSPLPIAAGGIGTGTSPSDKQMLVASGTSWAYKTLSSSTGISLTYTPTAIIIGTAGFDASTNIGFTGNNTFAGLSTFNGQTNLASTTVFPNLSSGILLTNGSKTVGTIPAPANGTGTTLSYQNGAWTSGLYQLYATSTFTATTTGPTNVATVTVPTATGNSVYDIAVDIAGTDGHLQTTTIKFAGNTLFVVSDEAPNDVLYMRVVMGGSSTFGTYFATLYDGYTTAHITSTLGILATSTLTVNVLTTNVGANSNSFTTTSTVTMMQ